VRETKITIGELWGVPLTLDLLFVAFWLAVWIILSIVKGKMDYAWIIMWGFAGILSTALHEISHTHTALKNGVKPECINLSIRKSYVHLPSASIAPDAMIKIALSGPVAGFSVGIVFFFIDLFCYPNYDALSWFARSLICIAELYQLLPFRPFDGGFIHDARLRKKLGAEGAEALIRERNQKVMSAAIRVRRVMLFIMKILLAILIIILCALLYLYARGEL